jgi:hypothetical protein
MPATSGIIPEGFGVGIFKPLINLEFGLGLLRARIISRSVQLDAITRTVHVAAQTNIACSLLILVTQGGVVLARADTPIGVMHSAELPIPLAVKGQVAVELEVSAIA